MQCRDEKLILLSEEITGMNSNENTLNRILKV